MTSPTPTLTYERLTQANDLYRIAMYGDRGNSTEMMDRIRAILAANEAAPALTNQRAMHLLVNPLELQAFVEAAEKNADDWIALNREVAELRGNEAAPSARMTEAEIHAHTWWCPHCRKDVLPEMVTKDGEHYLESGGCGRSVRGERIDEAAPAAALGAIWTHVVRGGEYTVIGSGKLQTDKPLMDMAEVVAYRGADGRLWALDAHEFDARFTRTRAAPPPSPSVTAVAAEWWKLDVDARTLEKMLSDYRHALLSRDNLRTGPAYRALMALAASPSVGGVGSETRPVAKVCADGCVYAARFAAPASPSPAGQSEPVALNVLATFAHEVMTGAIRPKELPAKARKALERTGLLSLDDVVTLAASPAGVQGDGAEQRKSALSISDVCARCLRDGVIERTADCTLHLPAGRAGAEGGETAAARPEYIKFTCVDCIGCPKCGVGIPPTGGAEGGDADGVALPDGAKNG